MKKGMIMALVLTAVMLFALLSACEKVDDTSKPCQHDYVDGRCYLCGQADPGIFDGCDHEYDDGNCIHCGEEDPTYDLPCQHTFRDGRCTQCGDADPCLHQYEDGVCTKCGAKEAVDETQE